MLEALQSDVAKSFFAEALEQSRVKAAITAKYFWAWANVFKNQVEKIAYVDLFAGPGRYDDGTKSTPLLILEKAIGDPIFRDKLVTLFNDGDPSHATSLEKEIAALPGINTLKYAPSIDNQLVGDGLASMFQSMRLIPTLCFIDPFGYKGLSLRLVNSVLKDFGCECLFFFNYNRINMGVGNNLVRDHMDALFGKDRMDALRAKTAGLSSADREMAVIEELVQALKELGGKYVLPFRFRNEAGTRTSHHLIFVTKHVKGYTIMKNVMAKESSSHQQGVASFEYNPADARFPALFALARPLDELGEMLVDTFAGKTLTVGDLIAQHHVDLPFIESNYKAVLTTLEMQGRVTMNPLAAKRPLRKGVRTLADHVVVTFPSRGN